MKFKILKDFKGSPTGATVEQYVAGTVVELTDSLAAVAMSEGWVTFPDAEAMIPAEPDATTVEPIAVPAPAPTVRRGRAK